MKSMTIDELRKRALAAGAELQVGGSTFNASRTQFSAKTRPKPVAEISKPSVPSIIPPPPPPPPAPVVEVGTKELAAVFQQALVAVRADHKPARKIERFKVSYDSYDRITEIVPVYAKSENT